jgi:hypothetical protein
MGLVSACSAWGVEGDGLVPRSDMQWPRWQGRLSVGTPAGLRADWLRTEPANVAVSGASLLGDFYFMRSLRSSGDGGGFRATSGLFMGSRSSSLLSSTPTLRSFNIERRNLGSLGSSGSQDNAADTGAVPYLGVGYTGLSSKGGWGFSADVGLMALSPGSAVKLGRVFSGNQSLDDALREMRLSPIVQVGVSYSF